MTDFSTRSPYNITAAPPVMRDSMVFSSSPVMYPPSSSPAPMHQKRKLFQTFQPRPVSPKRPRILGGFVLEEDSDSEENSGTPLIEAASTACAAAQTSTDTASDDDRARGHSSSCNVDKQLLEQQDRGQTFQTSLFTSSNRLTPRSFEVQTSSGRNIKIAKRTGNVQETYEQIIAQRSTTDPGRAKKAYYGIDIHKLIDEAKTQQELDSAAAGFRAQNEPAVSVEPLFTLGQEVQNKHDNYQLWTEKYRAKKFTDLVGDERTHRSVLRWLKTWDQIVFPGHTKTKTRKVYEDQEEHHKKILLLTGPPGLGKTTLAHVCAKQAGYGVLEINASDDRSRDVVKGRIKDALGTETVRGMREQGASRKAARPVCVVVDEVDGVVTGSGGSGGEGGFMKALIDLVQLDQRTSNGQHSSSGAKRKGDKFRLMRPLVLICNDVYAPSLRPLRQSAIAEIVHVRKPAIEKVIGRLKSIFEKESVACDNDAVRRLCESAWGLGTRKQNSHGGRGAGDGDIRGVLVQGEWMAHKLRASHQGQSRLTRKWVEENIEKGTASQNGLGRGGVKEVVERIFVEGAGLPNLPTRLSTDEARLVAESKSNPIGVADLRKRTAISALRAMIDTAGDHDRLMTECFATYPTQVYQDDTLLSKPNASYDWLHFHDMLSSRTFSGQEWELLPYLSTSACGFHDLFAAVERGTKSWNDDKLQTEEQNEDVHPFGGPKADFAAYEAEKASRATLAEMQAGFTAPMLRLFSSTDAIAMELVPNVSRMLAPEVKPVVVGGSGVTASVASVRRENEKNCVQHVVQVMHNLGIEFEKVKIETEGLGAHANGGYALRMEPPLDSLSTYHISKSSSSTNKSSTAPAPVRYAIRQVLSQELFKEKARQAALSRQARAAGLSTSSLSTHPLANAPTANSTFSDDKENVVPGNTNNKKVTSIETLTAIAAATASLSSAPGSSTVLPTNTNINTTTGPIKKDFFGRPILQPSRSSTTNNRPGSRNGTNQQSSSSSSLDPSDPKNERDEVSRDTHGSNNDAKARRTWVSFHEGYSNAVRKYISLAELMDTF